MRTHQAFKQPPDGSESDSLDELVDDDDDLAIPVIGMDSDLSASDIEEDAAGDDDVDIDDNDSSDFDPCAPDSDDYLTDEFTPNSIATRSRAGDTLSNGDDAKPSGSSGGASVLVDLNEDDEEDETVRAMIAAIKKPRTSPPEIKLDDYITDICFHPDNDIIALATVLGDVHLYKYGNDENTKLQSIEVHTKACRDIEFSEDGLSLISCSKDKSIMITDVQTEKLKKFYENAHEESVNKLLVIDENLFATGDDAGTVKLWDCRTNDAIFSLKEVEDYISAMLTNDAKKLLLVTSGDGYLTTINLGARKLFVQSEPYEEELTCMDLYRGDSKLIVGTSKGRIYTFNWGQFGYHCDMYPGIKTPISVMIPITDRIGCISGEDGIIKATHIAPYRNLGIVGQHNLPVIALDINTSGELIASSSDNNDVRFWNVKYFEDFGDIKYNEKHNNYKESRHNLPSSKFSNTSDFFSDLAKDE